MNTTRPVTQTAVFICVGQGYGFVDVSWIRVKNNNEEIPIPSKSIVTTMATPDNITSNLSIPRLKDSDDQRRYKCIYSNSGGKMDSNLVTLTIGSKFTHIMIISLCISCSYAS